MQDYEKQQVYEKLLSVWNKVQSAQNDGEGGLDYHSWKECVTNEVTVLSS